VRKKFFNIGLFRNTFFYYKKMLRWFQFTGLKAYFFSGLNFFNVARHKPEYANIFIFKRRFFFRLRYHFKGYVCRHYPFKMRNFYFKYFKKINNKFFIKNLTTLKRKIFTVTKNFNKKINNKFLYFSLPSLIKNKETKLVLNFWKNKNLLNLKNKLSLFFKFNKFLPKDILKNFFFSNFYNKLRLNIDASRRLYLLRKNKKLYSYFCKLKGKENEKNKNMDYLVFSRNFYKNIYKNKREIATQKKFQTLQANAFWR
jgi:hypothetical protein